MAAKKGADHLFGQIVAIFLLSRLLLEIIGILSLFYFPSARTLFHITDLSYHPPQPAFLEMWARWDSEWYLLIADHGYQSYDFYREAGHGKYLPEDTAKFFPAYPVLIHLLSKVFRNGVLAGVLISNVASIAFLYYFYNISSKLFDAESGSRASVFYLVFPTSLFLSAVYAESLFLAALLASFYYLEQRRLLPACIACALAMLTRPQAALAVPALLWLAARRWPEKRALALLAILLAVLLPLAGYLLYLQQTLGSFRWVVASQNYWRGEMHYPLYAFVRFTRSQIAIHGQHNSIIDFSFALLQLLVLGVSFRKLPGPYYLYSIMSVLFPLSSSLFSFSRLCLANFPFFLYLGTRLTGRWAFVMQIAFAMLLAFFMAAFANWYWVG